MPDANPGLMTIFADALEQPDLVARTAYLDRVCAGDASLRRRVEALLAAHDGAGRFLEPDATGAHEPPTQAPQDVTGTFDPDANRTSGILTGEFSPDPRTLGAESTPTADRGAAPVATGIIAGRYTLIDVIGEGGMGTVYRAEQSKPVKREVALKLIKAGMDSRAVLARFDAERQALALMDHPNIARVYDGGTTESGQPFFVMELVNGVPITQYCDNARLPVRARLELFVSVCNAVQHAHQKGIIHRDLKPGNVLVTEVDGRPTPKVIDFGVAKATEQRLTDQSLADTGAIVGTPAYMSPEQADPSTLDIDTRTDVYALGVILYELLVGSPPIDAKQFKRGAILEMLRMVREVDPPRPSTKLSTTDALPNIAANRNLEPAQLKRAIRGDLDWIVMKSLEKDRTRRYDTANGFAADILRHLSYEPVLAAPPSRAYRMRKFVRKNRGAVLAASLVVLALLTGIAGTTWGLLRADEEAGNARNGEAKAKQSEGAAIAARNELQKSNTALRETTDNLLSTAARSLLRPLALHVQPNQPLPPLNEQEIEPLWELASLKEEQLRLRFVEVGLQDSVSTLRLKDRGSVALHGSVGLDRERRTRVESLLSQHLQAIDISEGQQENVAFCLTQLGGLDQPLAERAAETVARAMTKTTDPYTLQSLAEGLAAVAAHMDPKDAAQPLGLAATTLTKAMTKTTDPNALQSQAGGLSAVVARMDPKSAAATFVRAMTMSTDPDALRPLLEGLSKVAARMDPNEASEIAATLPEVITKTTNMSTMLSLSLGLSAVATRMDPKIAAQVCGHAANALSQAMTKTTNPNDWVYLSESLSALASHMNSKEAAQTCGHAAATLSQAMTETTDPQALRFLSQGFSAVAAQIEPKDATKAAVTLAKAMTKTTKQYALLLLSRGLAKVAARVDSKEAAEIAAALTLAMTKTTDPSHLRPLLEGLSAVAVRIDSKEAAETAAKLSQTMTKTTNLEALLSLSKCLSAVAARMDPNAAAQMCGHTAAALTLVMTKRTTSFDLLSLSKCLSEVAARMNSKDIAQICGDIAATLTHAMTETTDPDTLQSLSISLSAVATRLNPNDAAEACGNAVHILTQAINKTSDAHALWFLSAGLLEVAARMSPKGAVETAATLTQAMTKTTNREALVSLSQGLSVVAAKIEPRTALHILIQAINKTTDTQALWQLSAGVAAVAARMDQKNDAEVCGDAVNTLMQVMTKTTDTNALVWLSLGLSAVATKSEPKDAAITLARATSNTTNPNVLVHLSEGLSVITARMEPKDAAQPCGHAAAILTQAMTKTTKKTDPETNDSLQSLLEALSAVLRRDGSLSRHQRLTSVASTVGAFVGPNPQFAAFVSLQPALKPQPSPLPPQTLVEILKNPFCVGEARRLVLEQLTRHYHRPFADQWEFVDYVHAQKLDLDLTTPPERPRLVP